MDAEEYRRRLAAVRAAAPELVLTGTALAPADALPDRVAAARAAGFARVRVDTTAGQLADAAIVRALRAAGVDAVSVAVAGAVSPPGNVGAPLIARIAVDAAAVARIEALVDAAIRLTPSAIELFNPADGASAAPLAAVEPALHAALERIAGRVAASVVGFPRCILGAHGEAFAPDPRRVAIEAGAARPLFHCFYARACGWYGPCAGLPEPYIERFGWEAGRLRPHSLPATPTAPSAVSFVTDDGDWLELLAGPDGQPLTQTALWSLEGVTREPGKVRFRFRLPDDARYDLVLEPRDRARRRHAETAGFNVTLVPLGVTPRAGARRLLFTLLPIVSRNDDGRLRLA